MSTSSAESFATLVGASVSGSGKISSNSPNHVEANVIVKPANKPYNAQVNLANCSGNLHLGTQITLNGPVQIKGLSRQDIISINENCNCDKKRFVQKKENRLAKLKDTLREKCTLRKCKIIVVIITLIYISILGIHFQFFRKNKVKINYSGFNESVINKLHNKLDKFVPRHDWERRSMRLHKKMNVSMSGNCTYECNINVKSKVRFLVAKNIWFLCSFDDLHRVCSDGLYWEMKRTLYGGASIKLNDLYYNYMIGMDGFIYGGRSLTCPFDEDGLIEDHSSMITIAIPYLFDKDDKKIFGFSAIIHLLDRLKSTGILMENYAVEFPEIFQNVFERLNKTMEILNASFHKNDFYNLTSKWNPEMMNNLLFRPREKSTNNSLNVKSIDLYDLKYFEEYKTRPTLFYEVDDVNSSLLFLYNPKLINNIYHTYLLRTKIKFRIISTYDKYSRDISNSVCESAIKCRTFLEKVISEHDELRLYPINYVVVLPDILYKVTTINDSVLFLDKNIYYPLYSFVPTVNILMLTPEMEAYKELDYWIESFSKLTKRIAVDIKRRNLLKYQVEQFKFDCAIGIESGYRSEYLSGENLFFDIIMKIYKILKADIKYGKRLELAEGLFLCV